MRDLTALVAALARVVKDERGNGEFRRRVRLRGLQLLDAMSALWGGLPPRRYVVAARTAGFRLSTLLAALQQLDVVHVDQLALARDLLRKTLVELEKLTPADDVPPDATDEGREESLAIASSPGGPDPGGAQRVDVSLPSRTPCTPGADPFRAPPSSLEESTTAEATSVRPAAGLRDDDRVVARDGGTTAPPPIR